MSRERRKARTLASQNLIRIPSQVDIGCPRNSERLKVFRFAEFKSIYQLIHQSIIWLTFLQLTSIPAFVFVIFLLFAICNCCVAVGVLPLTGCCSHCGVQLLFTVNVQFFAKTASFHKFHSQNYFTVSFSRLLFPFNPNFFFFAKYLLCFAFALAVVVVALSIQANANGICFVFLENPRKKVAVKLLKESEESKRERDRTR